MKKSTKALIPAVAALAVAATGCQTGPNKEKDRPPVVQEKIPAETIEKDTANDFFERLRSGEILQKSPIQSEMDK